MRVLVTTQVGAGHWRPLAPLARALQDAGHEVAFAATPYFCAEIGGYGFACSPVGEDDWLRSPAPPPEATAGMAQPVVAPAQALDVARDVFLPNAARRLPALLALARGWRPDLIVREQTEYAGCLAAERLGISHAALQISAWRGLAADAPVLPGLDRLRATLGLPPDPDGQMLYRHLLLLPFPPRYADPALPLPSTARFVRHVGFDHDGRAPSRLPDWFDALAAAPLVYATLGTAYNRTPGVFAAILAGLRDEPIELIATINHNQDPAAFGPQPARVHLERYLPQGLVMPRCALVVAHGGSGTVRTALAHGVPLVLIPIAADQPENARRCVALGVGRSIPPEGRTPGAIRAAVRAVLRDERYRRNAARLRDEFRALPDLAEAVALLARLAA
jgi:UDP:flavonoid glycosyltransferase YjiC (YdhE family)